MVVSEQLGHSSLAITADTYTSVLPAVAHAASEAVAGVIPRRGRSRATSQSVVSISGTRATFADRYLPDMIV